MSVLALDLGTKCGHAHMDKAGRVLSGTWNLKAKSSESIGVRYSTFRSLLSNYIRNAGVTYVVYEEVKFHRATDAAHVYGAYEGILQMVCIDAGIPYQGVGVTTILKHATGKGSAPKGEKKKLMFNAAVEKFKGTNVTTEDQADALCLLSWAQENLIY